MGFFAIGFLLLILGLLRFIFAGFSQGVGVCALGLSLLLLGETLIVRNSKPGETVGIRRSVGTSLRRGGPPILASIGWSLSVTGILLVAMFSSPFTGPHDTGSIVILGLGLSILATGAFVFLVSHRSVKRRRQRG